MIFNIEEYVLVEHCEGLFRIGKITSDVYQLYSGGDWGYNVVKYDGRYARFHTKEDIHKIPDSIDI